MFGLSKIALYAIAAAALLGLLSGIYFKGLHDGKVHEQEIQAIANAKAIETAHAKEAQDLAERDKRDQSYLSRIRDLEATIARPVPRQPIRLCQPSNQRTSPASTAPSVPDAASPAGEPVLQAGADIQPELVQYGRVCESLRIQLDELQKWVLATQAQPL